jgi:hypothetical protein
MNWDDGFNSCLDQNDPKLMDYIGSVRNLLVSVDRAINFEIRAPKGPASKLFDRLEERRPVVEKMLGTRLSPMQPLEDACQVDLTPAENDALANIMLMSGSLGSAWLVKGDVAPELRKFLCGLSTAQALIMSLQQVVGRVDYLLEEAGIDLDPPEPPETPEIDMTELYNSTRATLRPEVWAAMMKLMGRVMDKCGVDASESEVIHEMAIVCNALLPLLDYRYDRPDPLAANHLDDEHDRPGS